MIVPRQKIQQLSVLNGGRADRRLLAIEAEVKALFELLFLPFFVDHPLDEIDIRQPSGEFCGEQHGLDIFKEASRTTRISIMIGFAGDEMSRRLSFSGSLARQ